MVESHLNDREQWAKEFFRHMDARDFIALKRFIADDVKIRMGNADFQVGFAALEESSRQSKRRIKRICHDITGVWGGRWDAGDVVSVEAHVSYDLVDGRTISVPCTSTLRLKDGLVTDYRIFIDLSPLILPG